eukprot:6959063-Pyramimonas_sp.AAC.1
MALPKKLLAPSLPLGDDSFEKRVVDLYAASANSQTTYTSGDRLLFQFPNYARSFIDWSKSFLKFANSRPPMVRREPFVCATIYPFLSACKYALVQKV